MTLYGVSATVRTRKHTLDTAGLLDSFAKILNLYVPGVKIMEQLSGSEWAIIESIVRRGEEPEIPLVNKLAIPLVYKGSQIRLFPLQSASRKVFMARKAVQYSRSMANTDL
jgi:hypothetical protein